MSVISGAMGSLAASGGLAAAGSALSGAGGAAAGWLGGSSAGFSNAGLLGMGSGLLSSLGGALGARSEAKAMAKAQRLEWERRLSDTRENYKQIAQAEQQLNQEHQENLMQNQISLSQQQAELELMSAASGTGGQSITAMMTDLSATAGRNQATLVQNFENEQQSISNQLRAVQLSGQVEQRKFNKPSAFNMLASAVGAGTQNYFSAKNIGKEFSNAFTSSRTGTSPKV